MIEIVQKLKPFSHTPAIKCVLPRTHLILQAYPTRIVIEEKVFEIPVTGPVKNFTCELDLEKDCVRVFGIAKEGYFKIKIFFENAKVHLISEKGPFKSVFFSHETSLNEEKTIKRLSLGSHKLQNIETLRRDVNLKEIVPILYCLGQKIPKVLDQQMCGTLKLIDYTIDRKFLEEALHNFYLAGFSDLFVPRLKDDQYQGICLEEEVFGSAFSLLQQGALWIESLFFSSSTDTLKFLPKLPIDFDCGRMQGLSFNNIATVDFEWSKKLLRQVIISAHVTTHINLEAQKELKSFRIRKNFKEKGKRQETNTPFLIEQGKVYIIDRFQK